MAHQNKKMEEFFNNMPNPDAIFQSWWPWLIAGGAGTVYGFRCWLFKSFKVKVCLNLDLLRTFLDFCLFEQMSLR